MNDLKPRAVIVGVSGSAASTAALRWAAREARRRGDPLRAVLAFQPGKASSTSTGARTSCEEAAGILAGAVRTALRADPPDWLVAELTAGDAGQLLAERSKNARLLVLGSRSAPVLSSGSAGPVVRACLSKACCPVVVVGHEGLAEPAGEPAAAAAGH